VALEKLQIEGRRFKKRAILFPKRSSKKGGGGQIYTTGKKVHPLLTMSTREKWSRYLTKKNKASTLEGIADFTSQGSAVQEMSEGA